MNYKKNKNGNKYNKNMNDNTIRLLSLLIIHGTVVNIDIENWNKSVIITTKGEYINTITNLSDYGVNNIVFYDVTYFAVKFPDLDSDVYRKDKLFPVGNNCTITQEINHSQKRFYKLITWSDNSTGFEIHYTNMQIQFVE